MVLNYPKSVCIEGADLLPASYKVVDSIALEITVAILQQEICPQGVFN
jgi:hypothetical protein